MPWQGSKPHEGKVCALRTATGGQPRGVGSVGTLCPQLGDKDPQYGTSALSTFFVPTTITAAFYIVFILDIPLDNTFVKAWRCIRGHGL